MTEFVALVALGVLVLGLGVLVVAYLLIALGWLVVCAARRSRLTELGLPRAAAARRPRRHR